jgi:hypothetical protein
MMNNDTWRDIARPVIAEVIACFGRDRIGKDVDLTIVKKAISASYPFGERKYWPYKVWLSEVRLQLRRFDPTRRDPRYQDERQLEL